MLFKRCWKKVLFISLLLIEESLGTDRVCSIRYCNRQKEHGTLNSTKDLIPKELPLKEGDDQGEAGNS